MSADAAVATDDEACAVCGEHRETVAHRHLAPVGNFIELPLCEGCVADWGTVAPESDIGPQPGLTADSICLRCAPDDAGGDDPMYHLELEFPLAGQNGFVSVGLCDQHAREIAEQLLVDGGDGA